MKRVVLLASSMALTLGLALPAQAAHADGGSGNALTASEENELRSFMAQHGVSESTQDSLITDFIDGKMWDSLTNADPVDTEVMDQGKDVVTVETYADGSIAVSTVPDFDEAPKEEGGFVGPMSVHGCQYSGSTYAAYWTNCQADVNLGVIRQGFYFNYEYVNGLPSKITRYWGKYHHIIGGDLSNHRFIKFDDQHVRYAADYSVAFKGFPAGWTTWMEVHVSGSSAWTDNN